MGVGRVYGLFLVTVKGCGVGMGMGMGMGMGFKSCGGGWG